MTEEASSPVDFKPIQSSLLDEIRGELEAVNDKVVDARVARKNTSPMKPASSHVYAIALTALERLIGLTREILSPDLVRNIEKWFDAVQLSDPQKFVDDATTYHRLIDAELYKLGVKDTKPPRIYLFPMHKHREWYEDFDTDPDTYPTFSVRGTEAMG